MVSKRDLPAQLRTVVLEDDLEIEDDDFLDHQETVTEDEAVDIETELWFPLFPSREDELEEEWKSIFGGDASLRAAAPLAAAAYGATAAGQYSGSGRDLGIAARLRAYGLKVVEVAGWQTRGSATFHPRGSVDHHTAGPRSGNAPSLNICTNGRSDLPGPLCQVLIGRDNTCYVIASGRANHAGTGSYAGVTGNSNVYGVERENTGTGTEPWREDQRVTAAKVHAALLDWKRNGFVCQHKEWTSRKIDVWDQSGADMRARTVSAWNSYDKKEPQEMPLFKTHEERIDFVKKSYIDVAGREVESVETLNWWTWLIGSSELNALQLTNGLAKESRERQDRLISAAKAEAGTARTAAEAAQKNFAAAQTTIKSVEAAVAGISESLASGGGGSTVTITVDEVLSEIAARLQS